MSNKKKNHYNKQKTIQNIRTKEERSAEVRKVLNKLTELHITTEFEAIRELLKIMRIYVTEGIRQNINIDFPEFGRKIKGVLATNIREEVWVMIEKP